jgi:hypothetical protein
MAAQSFLEQRLDASTWPIAVGDLVVLLAFLLVGTAQHRPTLSPVDVLMTEPLAFVNAAAPFIIGWLIAAPLIGAYSPGGGSAPNSSIPLAIRSWIPAAVIGLAIRATPFIEGGVELTFAAVIIVGGAVVLAVWRFIYFKIR